MAEQGIHQSAVARSEEEFRASLETAHTPGRFQKKAARTSHVLVPQALVSPERGILEPLATPPECQERCLACEWRRLSKHPQRQPVELTPELAKGLAYGRGYPLRVLLYFYRWARAYAQTPNDREALGRLYNGSVRLPVVDQAGAMGLVRQVLGKDLPPESSRESHARSIRDALHRLAKCGLIEKVPDRAASRFSFYLTHAIGENPARLSQDLWKTRVMELQRTKSGEYQERISGTALLLLIVLLARAARTRPPKRGSRSLAAPLSQLDPAPVLQPVSLLGDVPISDNTRRDALQELINEDLVVDLRVGGTRYIVVAQSEEVRRLRESVGPVREAVDQVVDRLGKAAARLQQAGHHLAAKGLREDARELRRLMKDTMGSR